MTEVLVVGAGPYGIGVAQELWSRGCESLVVGDPFATWREHTPDAMLLRSDPKASGIYAPDQRYDFPGYLRRGGPPPRGPIPVTRFREYLEWVVEEAPFALQRDLVVRLARTERGFAADLAAGGRLEARKVVLATGLGGHTFRPAALAALPPERVLHSWQVPEVQALAGERVLVVGGGQSAAEAVDDLRHRNRESWLLRRPPFFFREPLRVPSPLFKTFLAAYGALYLLPPAVLRRLSAAIFRTTISPYLARAWNDPAVERLEADVEALGLGFAGGEIQSAAGGRWDRVVAATGYRTRVDGLPYLSEELAAELGGPEAVPAPDARFESAVPGLFLVGCLAEKTWGPAMRFILGSRQAARAIGRVLRPSAWPRRASISRRIVESSTPRR